VDLLFFLLERERNINATQARNDAFATYRKFLEPFLDFSVDNVALLVHKLGKLDIDVAKHLEDASARVKCVT
jgi:hypothetical protein